MISFSIRAYLPTLVPVEVDELKAREWFRLLLSGVEFLHKRGVVHNDIKYVAINLTAIASLNACFRPANILLSHENIPVLVDFGFAEKYDLTSENAFHSNLSYGTPEVRDYDLVDAFFLIIFAFCLSIYHRNALVAFHTIHASRTSGPLA